MDNVEGYKQLIDAFLRVNPTPTDEQFHALSAAANIDHETLESLSYAMLGHHIGADEQGQSVQAAETGTSEAQDVLDGDYDPNTTNVNDVALNDGAPVGSDDTQVIQDAEYNDGVGPDDSGVGINSDKDATISDGLPPLQLNAAQRLMAYSIKPRDFDKMGAFLVKRFGQPVSQEGQDGHQVKRMDFNAHGHKLEYMLWSTGQATIKLDNHQPMEFLNPTQLHLFIETQLSKSIH